MRAKIIAAITAAAFCCIQKWKGENGKAGSITSTITEICIACAFVSYLLLLKCISLLVWRMVFLVKYCIVFQLSGFRPLNSSFHFSLYFLCLVDSHSDMTRTRVFLHRIERGKEAFVRKSRRNCSLKTLPLCFPSFSTLGWSLYARKKDEKKGVFSLYSLDRKEELEKWSLVIYFSAVK